MARHIVIDNSNIYHALSHIKERLEPDVSWASLRLHLDNLFDSLEGRQAVETRAFIGSEKETAEPIWQKALSRSYDTYVLRRVVNLDGTTSEQAVDEIAHLVIANAILDHKPPQCLVIVSGDGSDSNFGTSFVGQAERALRHGWDVEIWSWFDGMTDKYDNLISGYPDRIKTFYLDCIYYNITYVHPGEFHHIDGTPALGLPRAAEPLAWPQRFSN